jgi:hypothetical protein
MARNGGSEQEEVQAASQDDQEHYYQKFRGKGGAQLDDHGQEK